MPYGWGGGKIILQRTIICLLLNRFPAYCSIAVTRLSIWLFTICWFGSCYYIEFIQYYPARICDSTNKQFNCKMQDNKKNFLINLVKFDASILFQTIYIFYRMHANIPHGSWCWSDRDILCWNILHVPHNSCVNRIFGEQQKQNNGSHSSI